MDKRCPLKLIAPPSEPCPLGQNLFKQFNKPYCKCKSPEFKDEELLNCKNCNKLIVKCCWGINSEENNYCFWKWNSNNNYMLNGGEIAGLLNLTVQRVGQIIKKSVEFIRQSKGFDQFKF